MAKYPHAIGWIDIETTGLDQEKDEILEVGFVITDLDLNKISGYEEVIKLTQNGLDRIKANEVVKEMHLKSGLIADARKATMTVAEVEQELISLLKDTTTFEKGEFMLGGSGVGAFDFPWLRKAMPEFAAWFAYFPFDIGVFRRVSKILNGKALTNPSSKSYGDEKVHRAMADVLAHIEEAEQYREVLRASSLAR